MSQLHSMLTANHRPYAAVYADATERLAATGFVRALGGGTVAFTSDDLYKIVLQLDSATEWVLTAITPTWVQVGGAGVPPANHAAEHENGGDDEIDVTGLSGVLADPQVADKIKESSGPTTLTVGAVADGQFLKRSGSDVVGAAIAATDIPTNLKTTTLPFIIDGGGSAITTGIKGDLGIDFNCTITVATMLADQSGSIVVDVWKDTYANFPPTDADSITASAPLTISSASKSQDSTLTGWTTSLSAGDILRFNVDSVATIQRVTIWLKVTLT